MPPTFDQIAEYIARGHAFPKHVEGNDPAPGMRGKNAFNDAVGGRKLYIETPEDLKDYIKRMVDSPDTRGFWERPGSLHLYNSRDNTYLILNDGDRGGDFGTIFRYADSKRNFESTLAGAKNAQRGRFVEFDNAETPGALHREVDNFANSIPARHPALQVRPGANAAADYPGTHNQAIGMSDQYKAFATTERQLDIVRASGVANGKGYVAAVTDKGAPSHMFFLDEATHRVTELDFKNAGAPKVTVHTFDNLPQTQQAAAANHFFELHRAPDAVITDGGYLGLADAHQARAGVPRVQEGHINSLIKQNISVHGEQVTRNIPYKNLDDIARATEQAARAYVGFTPEQANIFDKVPKELDAQTLTRIQDPNAVAAIRDLTAAKELTLKANRADQPAALEFFAETLDGMDAGTRVSVARALDSLQPAAHLDDAARLARGLDAASDLADVAKGLKAARLGMNLSKAGIITTVVTTGAAVALTAKAHAMTMDLGTQLHASGQLSHAAYRDYQSMMSDVGKMLTAQAADPLPTAIPGTFIVERIAYNRFKEFSDKHQLPQNIHEMLSPSMVAGTSLRGDIGDNTYRTLPSNPAQAPQALRELIEAKQQVESARTNFWKTYEDNQPPMWQQMLLNMGAAQTFSSPVHDLTMMKPAVQQADRRLEVARDHFQDEFDEALSDPRGARALAGLMTPDQLLEVVESTAKFSHDPNLHPLIKDFVQKQSADAGFNPVQGIRNIWAEREAKDMLLQHPEVMREYLSSLFVPGTRASLEPHQLRPDAHAFAKIEEDPSFVVVAMAFERMKGGDTLDPVEKADISTALSALQQQGKRDVVEELTARYPEQMQESVLNTVQSASLTSAVYVTPASTAPRGYQAQP